MKKFIGVFLAGMMMLGLSSCGSGTAGFDAGKDITVVSREDGSGTRSAFTELFDIQLR